MEPWEEGLHTEAPFRSLRNMKVLVWGLKPLCYIRPRERQNYFHIFVVLVAVGSELRRHPRASIRRRYVVYALLLVGT